MFQRALRIEYAHDLMLRKKCNQLSINTDHIYNAWISKNQLYVVGLIVENPTLYLAEICQHIHEVFALNVTPSTVCRLLRSYVITRKKIRCIALQRCDTLQGAFRAQCSNFSVDKFVWIDETGSDARSHARKYGYALRGLTPVTHRLHTRGKRVNAMAAIASTGLLASELTTSTVGRDNFI